jgi:hypothetical protein
VHGWTLAAYSLLWFMDVCRSKYEAQEARAQRGVVRATRSVVELYHVAGRVQRVQLAAPQATHAARARDARKTCSSNATTWPAGRRAARACAGLARPPGRPLVHSFYVRAPLLSSKPHLAWCVPAAALFQAGQRATGEAAATSEPSLCLGALGWLGAGVLRLAGDRPWVPFRPSAPAPPMLAVYTVVCASTPAIAPEEAESGPAR